MSKPSTVTLRNRFSKETMVVNYMDYVLGSIPGVDIGSSWDIVHETRGDDDADRSVAAQRELLQALDEKNKRRGFDTYR